MKCRMVGISTNELPKFLSKDLYENTRAIIVDDPLNPNEPLIITFLLKGVTSCFLSRKPRESEY